MPNNKIIAVVGPTASGKTALSVELAQKLNGEIISCDSMQIYKGMDIGTAKVTLEETKGIKHHLIDFVESTQEYSVSDYVQDATNAIENIVQKGKMPIFAGGTGLYLKSVLFGVEFTKNSRDDNYRAELEQMAENGQIENLYNSLCKIDPIAAENIHMNNHKRVIRALEYCKVTGDLFSTQSVIQKEKYKHILICLGFKDREKLYDRINKRVDIMMEQGLLAEAKKYLDANLPTAAQAIGYKELKPYIDGQISLETAVSNIKQATRRYAKRQLTWFKAQPNVNWIYVDEFINKEDIIIHARNIAQNFLEQGE